ncbi:putative galactose oxidase [Helianthus annuus]|nr:putative galactose oxidase [Helianthus annuus]
MLPNGDLISIGGNRLGGKSIRLFLLTDLEPKFVEKEQALGAPRWYSSNCVLEDRSTMIIGGRDSHSYDLMPPQVDFKPTVINLLFLQQTTEPAIGQGLHAENNLYPFTFLIPDGNVFIFANDRAIRFNPRTGEMAVLDNSKPIPVEVVVCGGNNKDVFVNVDAQYTQNRVFSPAFADCNRIKVLADKPAWEKEQDMPSPRIMGDLLVLSNGQFLLINGVKKGTPEWEDGEDPNLTPTVYMPEKEMGKRFKELKPTTIPRMYHSVSLVLPDSKILVAGGNSH